jgi:hypothetical protein
LQPLLFPTTTLLTVEKRLLRSAEMSYALLEPAIRHVLSPNGQENPALRSHARGIVRDMAQRFYFDRTG